MAGSNQFIGGDEMMHSPPIPQGLLTIARQFIGGDEIMHSFPQSRRDSVIIARQFIGGDL